MPRRPLLWNLFRRDLRLAPAALALPVAIFLLLPFLMIGVGQGSGPEAALAVATALAAFLGCLIPILLQQRERQFGTLPDLLALPMERRDLVALRWLEGVGFSLLFCLLIWAVAVALLPGALLALSWNLLLIIAWFILWLVGLSLPVSLRPSRWRPFALGIGFYGFLSLRMGLAWGRTERGSLELATGATWVQVTLRALLRCAEHFPRLSPFAAFLAEATLLAGCLLAAYRWSNHIAEGMDV
jgi:hypothetical protein